MNAESQWVAARLKIAGMASMRPRSDERGKEK